MKSASNVVLMVTVTFWGGIGARAQEGLQARPPEGPFGYTLVQTADGAPAEIDFFFPNETCGVCHPRHEAELQGSLHSAAHTEPLYRNLALLARKEAGERIYTFCSGCHSAAGVVSGLIPGTPEEQLPAEAKAGVSCDVCHQISRLTGDDGPWGEPGNGSFVLQPGRVKYGHSGEVASNRAHTGEKQDFFAKSEFCASCHTVIHPIHGLRIEHTYGEWKTSVYAEKGIQCQDCHMRSVEDAAKVAATLQPVLVRGQFVVDGADRPIFPHFFVGANANADRLAGGLDHAQMAEARLKSAARIELDTPGKAAPGGELAIDVLVHNIAAGHNIPTGVNELRQMWVELELLDQNGIVIDRFGGLDDRGEIAERSIRFGAIAGNRDGQATFRLWEMERFLWKRTIPPKSFTRDQIRMKLPPNVSDAITVQAKLFYRSASPDVVRQIMGDDPWRPKIVEMCKTSTTLSLE